MSKIQVYVVDSHEVARLGIACALANTDDLECWGDAETAEEAIITLFQQKNHLPDVVVTELRLTGNHGLELTKQIIKMLPNKPRVLIYSALPEILYAQRSLKAKAHGYIRKSDTLDALTCAIRKVASGNTAFSDEQTSRMLTRARQHGPESFQNHLELLSDREIEVFELIGDGKTTGEIAELLHLSPKTVETYRENLKTKLNLRNATELMRTAFLHTYEGNGQLL